MNGQEQTVGPTSGGLHAFLDLEVVDPTNHGELVDIEARCVNEPNNIVLLNYLANEYFRLGYFRKAEGAARFVIQREPSRAKAWQLLARCQLILGEKDGARESLTRCLEHPEAGSRTRKWSADRLDELAEGAAVPSGGTKAELAATDEMTEAVRQNLEARGVLTAITSPDRSQLESVGDLYRDNPDKEGVADWYAFLLYSNNETAAAIDVYRRMLGDFGASENTLYYLGCSYLRAANVKAALQHWNALKQQFPRSYFLPKMFDKVRRLRELYEQGFGLGRPTSISSGAISNGPVRSTSEPCGWGSRSPRRFSTWAKRIADWGDSTRPIAFGRWS